MSFLSWPALHPPSAQMWSGTVRCWQDHGGFGFIIPEEPGYDVFVHRAALQNADHLLMYDHAQNTCAWNQRKGKPKQQMFSGWFRPKPQHYP